MRSFGSVFATLFYALSLYSAIFMLFTDKIQARLQMYLSENPAGALLFNRGLLAIYLLYVSSMGGVELHTARVWLYWLVIPLLALFTQKSPRRLYWDLAIVCAVLLPYDLALLGRRTHALKHSLDWHIIVLAGVIWALVLFGGLRRLKAMKLGYRFCIRDIAFTLAVFVGFAFVGSLVATNIGFATPRHFLANQANVAGAAVQVAMHLGTLKYLGAFLGYTLTVALAEEIWFRGVLQNTLSQIFKNEWYGYITASLLFGAYHLNNKAAGWQPLLWNWKYAGLALLAGLCYGIVFKKTNSIWYAIVLHGIVDSVWHTLFQ